MTSFQCLLALSYCLYFDCYFHWWWIEITTLIIIMSILVSHQIYLVLSHLTDHAMLLTPFELKYFTLSVLLLALLRLQILHLQVDLARYSFIKLSYQFCFCFFVSLPPNRYWRTFLNIFGSHQSLLNFLTISMIKEVS